jgi:ABC-type oligopeptide transport system substrate-binding subunit
VVYYLTWLVKSTKPVPAADLLRRIQGAREFLQGQTPYIERLTVVHRYTLQLVLDGPLASGLAVLGLVHAAVVPQDEVERLGERFGRAPVGTWPFTFARWEPNQKIALEGKDHYYEGWPFHDTIV